MATAKQTDQDHEIEVSEKAKRRKFSDKYKLGILAKTDRCTASGEIGKLLRQEGLYSSQLTPCGERNAALSRANSFSKRRRLRARRTRI